ncbi:MULTISPECIES: DNA replication protein [Haloferax]|uniref:DNA replication protein n=1 Tax=Haloferax marinum TaxID=2666143 RepID=A0A6A8GB33_9EURY|nr:MULTISPECIES: DNA replication protein [Haloferax]KAB1198735.1 DNA replication protein [Haloferax sp. CBA1150]MRW97852.1 DNA replication protein [Haloferax marinum]
MNVDDLRSVLRTERQKDSLQQLRESFYEDVAEFIAQQKAMRNRKAEELGTHYSPEIRRITDEIETAEEVVISIYERRVGKVVKAASFAAAGMSSSTEGLTHEEKRLFEDLVGRIEQNRNTVLSTLEDVAASDPSETAVTEHTDSTDEPAVPDDTPIYQSESDISETPSSDPVIPPDEPDPEQAASTTDTDDAGDVLADAMGGSSDGPSSSATEDGDESSESPKSDRPADEARAILGDDTAADDTAADDIAPDDTPATDAATGEPSATPSTGMDAETTSSDDPLSGLVDDRETVRITADVGTILGVDEREYDLAEEDVVTLPSANAGPLVERGAAERLE